MKTNYENYEIVYKYQKKKKRLEFLGTLTVAGLALSLLTAGFYAELNPFFTFIFVVSAIFFQVLHDESLIRYSKLIQEDGNVQLNRKKPKALL